MVPAHITDVEKALHCIEITPEMQSDVQQPNIWTATTLQVQRINCSVLQQKHIALLDRNTYAKAAARLCVHTSLIHIISVPGKSHKRWMAMEHQQ